MKYGVAGIVTMVVLAGIPAPLSADIFEHVRPVDMALRSAMKDDRSQLYLFTPDLMFEPNEKNISALKKLGVDDLMRQKALHDTETAFELYLRQEFLASRVAGNSLPLRHPLVLLEYSSPVMADVIKHYRMTAYERLAMEQARWADIRRSTESRADRLSRQSERECLERHADKGLVEAMRLCMVSAGPMDDLVSVNGAVSLNDGRRRIHVIEQALARLGFEKGRIRDIVGLTGDKVVHDKGYEDVFPRRTFEGLVQDQRQELSRKWRELLLKYRDTHRMTVAQAEDLSLPGVPVTAHTMDDLDLLDDAQARETVLKLAFIQAMAIVSGEYRQALAYLQLCMNDPALNEEFRRIIVDRKDQLQEALKGYATPVSMAGSYKDQLAALAQAADRRRAGLDRSMRVSASAGGAFSAGSLLLNY
ncbi:MAG: hypothetical protein HQL17_03705 [Candidatus Omnitrophica bacterium]|nr:hypothetical protein [Candidatus Omnitrophota bacterium]